MSIKTKASPAFLETLDPLILDYLSSHQDWVNNRFPNAGGLRQQPYRWVRAMRILDSENAKIEMADRAKSKTRNG